MRRLADLRALHVSDLGGDDLISHSERVLVARSSMIVLQCEMLESSFADNDGRATTEQLETLQRCTNTLRRTFRDLGLKRRPRDVTPTLAQYLESTRDDDRASS